MKKIVLLTNDNSLKKELTDVIPKDFKVEVNVPVAKNSVIFLIWIP